MGNAERFFRVDPHFEDAEHPHIHTAAYEGFDSFIRWRWGLNVVNGENFPRIGSAVIVPEHFHNIDPFAIGIAYPRPMIIPGKEKLWTPRYLYVGHALEQVGTVYLDRENASREDTDHYEDELLRGKPALVFLHGTRVREEKAYTLPKDGPAYLAMKASLQSMRRAVNGIIPDADEGRSWIPTVEQYEEYGLEEYLCPIVPVGLSTDILIPKVPIQVLVGEALYPDPSDLKPTKPARARLTGRIEERLSRLHEQAAYLRDDYAQRNGIHIPEDVWRMKYNISDNPDSFSG